MWLNYIKIALRVLIRNRRISLINLIGFTLAMTGFIIIFSWVRAELSRDRFHEARRRIVQLSILHPDGILDPNAPYALAPRLARQYPEIESYASLIRLKTLMNSSFLFREDTSGQVIAYENEVVRVDTSFFSIFDLPVIAGSEKGVLGDPGNVVISKRIADLYYGDTDPVGRSILMNGNTPLTISGVVDIPENSFFGFDLFLPKFEEMSEDWNWRDPSYLFLRKGTDIKKFEKKISSFFNDNYPHPLPGKLPLRLIPIAKTHLALNGRGKVFLFSCVAVLLLIIAALNYINLSTANFNQRIMETGIRKILGAKRAQMMAHFFSETIILSLTALLLSLFLAEFIMPVISTYFGMNFKIGYLEQPILIPVLLLAVITIAGLASLYPALVFTKGSPSQIMHGTNRGSGKRSGVILVTTILQFTLAITLAITALVVFKQVRYMSSRDLGLSVDNVISIPMNQGLGRNFFDFFLKLKSHPDIEMVSAGQALPFNEDYKTNIEWMDQAEGEMGLVRYSICLSTLPELFGMEVLKGRYFSEDLMTDRDRYLINESAASMLGSDDPVGKQITMWGRRGEIVGVVKDFNHVSLHRDILPHVFNIHPANYGAIKYIFIKLRSGKDPEVISFIKTTCEEYSPGFPFAYSYLEEDVAKLYLKDYKLGRFLALFAILALILSLLGIYGLSSYSVDRMSEQIAIRKVFGAELEHIIRIFILVMLKRMGIGMAFAILVSVIIVSRWLQTFAFRVRNDVFIFIIPALLAAVIALSAMLIAVWGNVRRNPVDSLRQE